jgi:predicted ester cyclase
MSFPRVRAHGKRNPVLAWPRFGFASRIAAMTVEDNVALVRRFYEEAWNHGRTAVCDELFDMNYVRHDLRPTQAEPGPSGMKQIVTAFRAAFPDIQFRVDIVFGSGDMIAARWTATGSHTGAWGGIDATGRTATFSGVNLYRFAEGKTVELWNHRDDLGLQQQLGVAVFAGAAPTPNATPTTNPPRA